jgi:hypothetical protein
MNHHITDREIIQRLEENSIPYGVLTLASDIHILITQRGGRVFGPFLEPGGPSLYWVNPAFAAADTFREFLAAGEWNLGGERIWIAPEVQFLVRDRSDFWNSLHFPPAMDPGAFTLEQTATDTWRLYQELALQAYNLAAGLKTLHLENVIRPVQNPLRTTDCFAELMDGVTFAGYEQVLTLAEDKADGIVSEVWNLIQLNPGGVLIIPASPRVEYTDYFEPIDAAHQTISTNHVRLRITGQQRYKVGYKAAHLMGRLGYINRLDTDRSYLLVRNFFNNPSAGYAEEPAGRPGRHGHSVHVYNDGGGFGGFGELECMGQTIGGATGRAASTDQMVLWLYVGNPTKLREIAIHLLGIDPQGSEATQ